MKPQNTFTQKMIVSLTIVTFGLLFGAASQAQVSAGCENVNSSELSQPALALTCVDNAGLAFVKNQRQEGGVRPLQNKGGGWQPQDLSAINHSITAVIVEIRARGCDEQVKSEALGFLKQVLRVVSRHGTKGIAEFDVSAVEDSVQSCLVSIVK